MFLFKNKFLGLFIIILGLIVSSLFFLQSRKIIFAGENLGGWAWNAYQDEAESGIYYGLGWVSESCNNMYANEYQDWCGIDVDTVLDLSFDGEDIDLSANTVRDNSPEANSCTLNNFTISNLRNGGRDRNTGLASRNSNFNNSLYFNGIDNYITIGGGNLGNQLTIAWWAKAEAKSEIQGLFNIGGGGIYNTGSESDKFTWDLGSAQVDIDNAFLWDDDWHYYVVVRNNTNVKFYRDGDYINEDIFSNNGNTGKFDAIGRVDGLLNYWQGELDEIRIFEEVLTTGQIVHNMHHNANYLLNIEENTGEISGWTWSNSIGWICFGDSCEDYNSPPDGTVGATLHWTPDQANDIYPHMITGWAKAITLDDSNIPEEINTGWIRLQGPDIIPNQYNDYLDCISCIIRDEEAGLRGFWKFNESSGDILTDYSGDGKHGDLINFTGIYWNEDGYLGNCLDFDGENDYVDVGSIPLSTISSITWWAKAGSKDEEDRNGIFMLGNGSVDQGISTSGADNNNFFWEIEDPIQLEITNAFLWGDEWHYYAVVRNNGNVKFYRDGAYFGENNFDFYSDPDYSDISKTQALKSLGFSNCDTCGGNIYFNGQMDYARFYEGILLSQDDIEFSFTHPEKRSCSACLKQNVEPDPVTNNICYQCEQCGFDIEDIDEDSDEGEIICEQCASCRKYGLAFDSNAANIKGYAWSGFENDEFGNNRGLGWIKFSPNYGAGLYRSYLSTRYGNIYSQGNIGSDYTVAPPAGYFNATYMIQADGHVTNWTSSQMSDLSPGEVPWLSSVDTGQVFNYEFPKLDNDYGNVLGNLDYQGLLDGLYGEREDNLPFRDIGGSACLGGKVYSVSGNISLDNAGSTDYVYIFENCDNAAGTIIIDGDLIIDGNIAYENIAISGESIKLASVAWIIKGDLKISGDVEKLAGTFIVLGADEIDCGSDFRGPTESCGTIYTCYEEEASICDDNRLIVSGQFIAKNFSLQRTFRSLWSDEREAAELIIYDGRNVINPPPGLGDVLKTFPRWDQIAPY